MTIAELQELLAQHPPDLTVMVDGYEAGYDDLAADQIALRQVQLNVNSEWYYGQHDDPEPPGTPAPTEPPSGFAVPEETNRDGPIVTALLLSRPGPLRKKASQQDPRPPLTAKPAAD